MIRWMEATAVVMMVAGTFWNGPAASNGVSAGEIRTATDRPPPMSPEASAACVQLMPGFALDLVAAEPMLRDVTAIAFNERGELFACEIHGYNLDGYLDILELNKTGKLDREVRRVRHASPRNQAEALKETYGTVRLLRDTDGDGRMDEVHVWADRLPPCYGVVAARGGVIAVCAPDIVFLADRDGDGVAEIRETLLTGFARELIERGMSNPRWGPDNWIYVAAGGGGGTITGPNLKQPVTIGNTDFRIRSDGSAIEPVAGGESMFGLTMTDIGDRFHTVVQFTTPLPYHYLARNPYVESPPAKNSLLPGRAKLFPISQPDPWRQARGQDPAWVKFYGAGETEPNGSFTASSGQMIYRADALPVAFQGNYFVCDPANNLVHRELLTRQGSEYVAARPAENATSEFLASSDRWFRPINLSVGPDGAIYVVDMYREIIEDFSAIPRYLQQQYAESLVAGSEYGRIWRVSWQGDQGNPRVKKSMAPVRLDLFTDVELVQYLDHPNHWWRETAQRLLVERQRPAVRAALAGHARSGANPTGRMLALHALDGVDQLQPEDVLHALNDESEIVRVHALQLADRWLDQRPDMLDRVLGRIHDAEPRVRLQVALTLGASRDPRAVDALATLAAFHGDERWMSAAIASSIVPCAEVFLTELLNTKEFTSGTMAVVGPVAETIGAMRDATALGNLLACAAALSREDASVRQLVVLQGVVRGLQRGQVEVAQHERLTDGLEKLLTHSSFEVAQQALRIVGLLRLGDAPALQGAWEATVKRAMDAEHDLPSRLAAIDLLSVGPWSHVQTLGQLVKARQPTELQLAVIKTIGQVDHVEVADTLVANWSGVAPQVQEAIIDALFARQDRLVRLLDAVQREVVPGVFLGSLRREQLLEHSDPTIRERAVQVLAAGIQDDRAAVLQQYQTALSLPRDPQQGAMVYERTCLRCHRLGDKGHEVGPDLRAARTRPDETLLVDIMAPSANLAHGYTVYAITTTEGRVYTGLLADDSATSVTLRTAAEPASGASTEHVVNQSILRKDIEEMRAMTKSLMPDGLEKELTPQDLANLIGFLRQTLGPVMAATLVLFDDDPAFVSALTEGDARASITLSDQHSGDGALLLTAGQRYAPRINGWNYRVVERPILDDATSSPSRSPVASASPGGNGAQVVRYLRFSWKSAGATGVMLELAANGDWPAADDPGRRYYSGRNTSGWAATEISSQVPCEWTTVTVDLWKEVGEFTLTGMAPTAIGGPAMFDRIELLTSVPEEVAK